jgi:hypothetical protein
VTTPAHFPVWLSKPGAPDMLVLDAGAFNNALASGYTYGSSSTAAPTTTTPSTTKPSSTGVTVMEVEVSHSPAQVTLTFDQISHGARR